MPALVADRYALLPRRRAARVGGKAGARAAYERFLRAWSHADRALPEVADSERVLNAM